MNVDPVMFEAFQRESSGRLPDDVRSWALSVLLAGLPYRARMAERDRALRFASAFLPEELTMAERVRQLHAELLTVARATRPAHPDLSSMKGCLAYALLVRDLVPKPRQLWNILEECNS